MLSQTTFNLESQLYGTYKSRTCCHSSTDNLLSSRLVLRRLCPSAHRKLYPSPGRLSGRKACILQPSHSCIHSKARVSLYGVDAAELYLQPSSALTCSADEEPISNSIPAGSNTLGFTTASAEVASPLVRPTVWPGTARVGKLRSAETLHRFATRHMCDVAATAAINGLQLPPADGDTYAPPVLYPGQILQLPESNR